jgi:phage I-like protein/cation transport regulator ChaB
MPYSKLDELPPEVKALPNHGQEIWMAAFNSAFEQYKGDEEKCFATAWAAVKNKYKKEGDEWTAIEKTKADTTELKLILKEIEGAPSEFQLLPMGEIKIRGEAPAYLDPQGIGSIMRAFKEIGNDMVIDYEHQTLADKEAPAAGWIKNFIDKGKEGLSVLVEWTEKAKQYLINKEYRFYSPVFWITAKDRRIVGIENVALTNYPKIMNLKPIVAKAPLDKIGNQKKEGNIMLEKLKKSLGLAAEVAEEKVTEAVELLVNKVKSLETMVACKEVLDAVGAKTDAGKEEVLQIIGSLKAPGDVAVKLSLEVASLRKELSEIKQNGLIELALKEGKTSPDELEKWGLDLALKNPEQFKLIVLSRPAGSVVPIGGIPSSPKDRQRVIDDVQGQINKMMGIGEETWKKYNAQ